MSFEKYTKIYDDYKRGTTLRVDGKKHSFKFTLDKREDTKYRLFGVGETGLFYQWKNEPDNPMQYRLISDSLDPKEAELAAFALNMSSKKPEKYIRRAYKKLLWTPKLAYINMNPTPTEWTLGFRAKAEDLKIQDGGYIRMRADIRYKLGTRSAESIDCPPDERHIIDISDSGFEWREYEKHLTIGKNVASIAVFIEGVGYSGKVYIEAPHLTSPEIPDKSVLPDFSMPVTGRSFFDWTGQYLSHKEWPEFKITLNGKLIFDDELFDRCHRGSELALDIPSEALASENTLEIELTTDCHDPIPYHLFELGIVATPAGDFAILSASEAAPAGGKAYALIRTEKPKLTLRAEYSDALSGDGNFYFEEAGLHGISFECKYPAENAEFTLTDGKKLARGSISRIVIHENDNIVTGSGDLVYIKAETSDTMEFLAWYVAEGIGNMLTVRPTYRWSGTRTVGENAMKELARVLNELGMKYPHMLDGRELPGFNANPGTELLAGEGFLGRQMHEKDGAMFYWGRYKGPTTDDEKQFLDMMTEIYREDPEHTNPISGPLNFFYPEVEKNDEINTAPTFDGDDAGGEVAYAHRNPNLPHDTEFAYHEVIERINAERDGNLRHTGPSTLFKYMYDGGYEWVGAETMYGTMEPLMAFLRGASLDRGKESIGVHHALQWSSSPEEAPEHVRRYRLALYVSYMHGAHEINSEEGLWHLEEYYSRFNRFSDACKAHAEQQKDFYRYISTHTRRGKFYTPMGLLHGRYDGWHGFGRNTVWGWKNVKDSYAEKSWDSLSVFYPEGNLGDSLYCHGFPTDKPLGFYSSTPIGNIDVVPVEAHTNRYSEYKALAFMGYNKAEYEDTRKLRDFVKEGGHLLLTLAHLSCTTDYESIFEGDLSYNAKILELLGIPSKLTDAKIAGEKISVIKDTIENAEIIATSDDGKPLAVRYPLGEGEVTLFTASIYPAHPAIKDLYEAELKKHAEYAASTSPVWASANDGTEFTVYRRDDGSYDVYCLAVDWYRDPELKRSIKLRIADRHHTISLPFGIMIKATVCEGYAAYPDSENAEVISIKDGIASLQGTGRVKFTLINGNEERVVELDFNGSPVQEIKI